MADFYKCRRSSTLLQASCTFYCDKNPPMSHTCGCIYDDNKGKKLLSRTQSNRNDQLDQLDLSHLNIQNNSEKKFKKQPISRFEKEVDEKNSEVDKNLFEKCLNREMVGNSVMFCDIKPSEEGINQRSILCKHIGTDPKTGVPFDKEIRTDSGLKKYFECDKKLLRGKRHFSPQTQQKPLNLVDGRQKQISSKTSQIGRAKKPPLTYI